MDNIFYLINVNDVKGLSEVIFNKKLSSDSPKGYASCMSNQEEAELVKKLLQTNDKRWLDFIEKYIEHFPLSAEATLALIEHCGETTAKSLLAKCWEKYGANEEESIAFCNKLHSTDNIDEGLLAAFCDSARLIYDDANYKLSLIDNKWSERYVNASRRYFQNTH